MSFRNYLLESALSHAIQIAVKKKREKMTLKKIDDQINEPAGFTGFLKRLFQ